MDGKSVFAEVWDRFSQGWSNFFWDAFVALGVNGISGDYVEFGSAGGNTLRLAYEVSQRCGGNRHLWAFDSFSGLPVAADPRDEHPMWAPGVGDGVEAFRTKCDQHAIPREAYTAVEGFYEDSLRPTAQGARPTDIALAYIDCNMYSSTVSVLRFLEPRLKHGMIVAFDDYYCYSPTHVSGEREALREFTASHSRWNFLRYKEIHWAGVSFIVEDTEPQGTRGAHDHHD